MMRKAMMGKAMMGKDGTERRGDRVGRNGQGRGTKKHKNGNSDRAQGEEGPVEQEDRAPGEVDPGSEDGGRRPTPVRLAMDSQGGGSDGESSTSKTIRDPKDDREWLVAETGRAGSGILPLRSVPLLEVVFSRPEDPETPLRRALTNGERLEDLGEEGLLDLFRRSRALLSPDAAAHPSKGRDRRRGGKRNPGGLPL
jgi:hypothetical protein